MAQSIRFKDEVVGSYAEVVRRLEQIAGDPVILTCIFIEDSWQFAYGPYLVIRSTQPGRFYYVDADTRTEIDLATLLSCPTVRPGIWTVNLHLTSSEINPATRTPYIDHWGFQLAPRGDGEIRFSPVPAEMQYNADSVNPLAAQHFAPPIQYIYCDGTVRKYALATAYPETTLKLQTLQKEIDALKNKNRRMVALIDKLEAELEHWCPPGKVRSNSRTIAIQRSKMKSRNNQIRNITRNMQMICDVVAEHQDQYRNPETLSFKDETKLFAILQK